MSRINNTHPGVILLNDHLIPLQITLEELSKLVDVPIGKLNKFVDGREKITKDMAEKFSFLFNTTVEFWINLQCRFDGEDKCQM